MHKIKVILYDDLSEDCTDIAPNLVDLTQINLENGRQLDVIQTQDIDQTLKELANTLETEWVVVVAAGTYLESNSAIFDTVDYAKENQAPLAAHLLDYGGYFHFHPQWFALDLTVYRRLAMPSLQEVAQSITLFTRDTERSQDNVHDDYTPLWLAAKSQTEITYQSNYGYFGVRLVAAIINAGHKIVNVPQQARQKKSYSYPNKNHQELRGMIQGTVDKPQEYGLHSFYLNLQRMKDSLNIGYYITNTEPLMETHTYSNLNFDCFVGVASGFKPAMIVGQDNFDEHCRVLLIDISPAALEWQQYLREHWSGDADTFNQVCEGFREQHPTWRINIDLGPQWRDPEVRKERVETSLAKYLSVLGLNDQEFKRRWNKYQNCEHSYLQVDLLGDSAARDIVPYINKSSGTYVWTSNAFYMDYLMFYRGNKWAQNQFQSFQQSLREQSQGSLVIENCNTCRLLS